GAGELVAVLLELERRFDRAVRAIEGPLPCSGRAFGRLCALGRFCALGRVRGFGSFLILRVGCDRQNRNCEKSYYWNSPKSPHRASRNVNDPTTISFTTSNQ